MRGENAARIFQARDCAAADLNKALPHSPSTASESRTDWLVNSARALLDLVEKETKDKKKMKDTLVVPLLYIFLAHGVTLDKIPLPLRAQPLPAFTSDLEHYLRDNFLPSLFDCLHRTLPSKPTFRDVDLDGRVFLHLLQAVPPQSSIKEVIANLIGPQSACELDRMWQTLGRDIGVISCCVVDPKESMVNVGEHVRNVFSVLPFSHPILSQHLARVNINITPSTSVPECGRFDLDSSLGAVFKDSMHWHNAGRSILPKHLGGKDTKLSALDARARKRVLRRNQQFQAGLQRQAETLTGALGKPLETIIIPQVGRGSKVTTPKTVSPSEMCLRYTPLTSLRSISAQKPYSGPQKEQKADIHPETSPPDSDWQRNEEICQ